MKKRLLFVGITVFMMMVSAVFPVFASLQYQEMYTSTTGTTKVLVLINSAIYDAIYADAAFKQWIEDLEAENYNLTVTKIINGTAQEVKNYIKLFSQLSIQKGGVIFIGDLPIAQFEMNYLDYGYVNFPTDLFYMDLGGQWRDIDGNNIYDVYTPGNAGVGIWLGRLTASPIKDNDRDEVTILRNYFAKNNAYRRGKLSINKRALAYDDAFGNYLGNGGLDSVYSNVTVVNDGDITNAVDYKNRLKENYEWIDVVVHSNPNCHCFLPKNDIVTYFDIYSIDPVSLFYTLEACSNCKYTTGNYMGGHYIFTKTNGLAAIGSTKIVYPFCLQNSYFYLGQDYRKNLGTLFNFFMNSSPYSACVGIDSFQRYGMTFLGDPTLSLDPPIAVIDSITINSGVQGKTVTFTGLGKIGKGTIIDYSWRSSINGYLSNACVFTRSLLSQGKHIIYFKVKDNNGRWSSEAKYNLSIDFDTTPPTTPVVVVNNKYTQDTAAFSASWSSSDPESGISEYQYAIGTSFGANDVSGWTSIGKNTAVTKTGLSLKNGKTYFFSVKAKNGANLWSKIGCSNGVIVDTTPPTIPIVIDEGSYTRDTAAFSASWSSSDPESGIKEYSYKIGESKESLKGAGWTSAGTKTSITITGLKLIYGKTYYLGITATNNAGLCAIGYSDGILVSSTLPAPSSLKAAALPDAQVKLTWKDNSNDENGFKIERKIGASGFTQIAVAGPNAVSFVDSTVLANTKYSYRVCAYNDKIGNSKYSNIANITTPAALSRIYGNIFTKILGKVTSLSGVDISITKTRFLKKIKTDTQGNYDARNLPEGLYTIIISKQGYRSQGTVLKIPPAGGFQLQFNFELLPS